MKFKKKNNNNNPSQYFRLYYLYKRQLDVLSVVMVMLFILKNKKNELLRFSGNRVLYIHPASVYV